MKGLGRGGAERLTVDCVRSFDRSRWVVDVAYVLPHKDALVDDLRTAGISVRCLSKKSSQVGWIGALVQLVRTGDYDLIHRTVRCPPFRYA